jgi:hypothetical protein
MWPGASEQVFFSVKAAHGSLAAVERDNPMTRVSVRLPDPLHAKFRKLARDSGRPQSELVRQALERLLIENGIQLLRNTPKSKRAVAARSR